MHILLNNFILSLTITPTNPFPTLLKMLLMYAQFVHKQNVYFGINDLVIHPMNAYTLRTNSLMAFQNLNTLTPFLKNVLCAFDLNRPRNPQVLTPLVVQLAHFKVCPSILVSPVHVLKTKNDRKTLSAIMVKLVGFLSPTTSAECLLATLEFPKLLPLFGSTIFSKLTLLYAMTNMS